MKINPEHLLYSGFFFWSEEMGNGHISGEARTFHFYIICVFSLRLCVFA